MKGERGERRRGEGGSKKGEGGSRRERVGEKEKGGERGREEEG